MEDALLQMQQVLLEAPLTAPATGTH